MGKFICEAIGSRYTTRGPPAEAVAEIRKLIVEAIGMTEADRMTIRLATVDAQLLEARRLASSTPTTKSGNVSNMGRH